MHSTTGLIIIIAALFAGCASQSELPANSPDWIQHSSTLRDVNHWQARGKLALRSSEQSESANLLWRQQLDQTYIHLSGPMGIHATTIRSDRQQLQVERDGQSDSWDISSPEATQQRIGLDLPPLHALPYWIKGIPAPEGEIEDLLLDNQLLQQFSQNGWQVTYDAYQQFEQMTLPTRLRLQRGDTSARLIIRSWSTLPQQ